VKLAVMLKDLGVGQLAHALITGANALLEARTDLDVVALYECLTSPCVLPHFATMQVAEGWTFDGVVVATDLSTAAKLQTFPSAVRKLFMVWDLEWVGAKRPYRELAPLYRDPEFALLARSADHARAIRGCWNVGAAVVGDLDLSRVLEECGAPLAVH
jgi:hypothetical protein